jgi:hypothetical protein
MEPAALLRTLAYTPRHGCGAICVTEPHRPAARRQLNSLGADHRQSSADDLSTTLVLCAKAPVFSTDAGNSALIVNNEVSATPCDAISVCPAANEKSKNWTSIGLRLAHQGGTPCHGTSFLDDNS